MRRTAGVRTAVATRREDRANGSPNGAAATRWVSLGVLLFLIMLLVKDFPKLESRTDFFKNALVFLVMMPVFIYFSTHIILSFIKGYGLADLWRYQIGMFRYHATLKAVHNYGSPWWSWPLLKRPIWYFFERREGLVYGILCLGNPALVWMLGPAMIYLAWKFLKRRCWTCALILAGFLSQWVPWAFLSRVKFFHYFYTAMPFLALAITFALKDLWKSGRPGKIAVTAYTILVLCLFVYWYPLMIGYPITEAYFQNHLWFKSWI